MLYANNLEFRNEQGIFPLIEFVKHTQQFRCLGTCFFINGFGTFVTAKHVIKHAKASSMMYIVQMLSDSTAVNREITYLSIHPTADIAVGQVGVARDPLTAKEVEYELAPNCSLSFKRLENGTPLKSFGYPHTSLAVEGTMYTFQFRGVWSRGYVEDYHFDGFSRLKNSCYQTSIRIDSGCSGGPVFKDGHVVGEIQAVLIYFMKSTQSHLLPPLNMF